MVCPTCSHAMACVLDNGRGVDAFHCERCGTAIVHSDAEFNGDGKMVVRGTHDVYVPKLVQRCREFAAKCLRPTEAVNLTREWHRLGIAESINVPADRPD